MALSTEATSRLPWSLIGLKLDDAAVKQFISQAAGEPVREEVEGYGVFIELHREGVDLSSDTSGNIMTVILYASPNDTYQGYSGPLPRMLTWQMSRADVERTIGRPAEVRFSRNSKVGRTELYADYPELGLYLNYHASSESDMQARLLDMRIKNPRL